jgi:hypothetical protein
MEDSRLLSFSFEVFFAAISILVVCNILKSKHGNVRFILSLCMASMCGRAEMKNMQHKNTTYNSSLLCNTKNTRHDAVGAGGARAVGAGAGARAGAEVTSGRGAGARGA